MSRALTVTFKGKPAKRWSADTGAEYLALAVPRIESRHCDMHAFRASRRFGGLANSDMFPAMIQRAVREIVGERIRLADVPAGVTVAPGSLLHTVTITLEDRT